MQTELVQVRTKDGVTLHGAHFAPTVSNASGRMAVCVHGTGSNFYSSTLFDSISDRLLDAGIGVVRINTRGHDGISTAATVQGGRRIGAAYEIVDECRHDLAAWVDFARDRGAAEVILIGHSMGAVKCLYAAAKNPNLNADRVVAVSPPRLSCEWFRQGPHAVKFKGLLSRAQALANAGEGQQLLEVDFPLPMILCAAGYVDKYGPQERYNFLPWLPTLRQPVHFVFGTVEVERNWAFTDLPTAVRDQMTPTQTVTVIEGTDHFYTGKHQQLTTAILDWL